MPNSVKLPPEFSGAQLVGQSVRLHDGSVTAIITCNCDPTNLPMFIKSEAAAVICRRCYGAYQIISAEYDVRRGPGIAMAIAKIGQAKPVDDQALTRS